MARLCLCAVVLAALLLAAAHAERIEDASEEDDAGLGYIVTLNDDDADAEDLCAALAADTDDFNTGGVDALDFYAEFPLLRRYEQVACARRVQGICRRVFRRGALGINGMVVDAVSRGRIRALARCLPNAVVEPDLPVSAQALDSGNRVPWNLDRLDQAFLPLDGVAGLYTAANGGGDGVHAYVIDSGVRATHREFTVQSSDPNDIKYGWDKTSRVERGVDLVVGTDRGDLSLANRDCDGHGTHIAATLAGTHVGVAPLATVHPARVLDCRGDGRASDVVAALDWCAGHIVYNRVAKGGRDDADASTHPVVATLALGLMAGARSIAMERAVAQFTRRTGALVVVAAGNFRDADACDVSPARVPSALTVGASGSDDRAYVHGASGPCVDAWVPGVDIRSACGGARRCENPSDESYVSQSGTSMAVGHAAGIAALFLGEFPGAEASDVKTALVDGATGGIVWGRTLPGTTDAMLRVPTEGWTAGNDRLKSVDAFGL